MTLFPVATHAHTVLTKTKPTHPIESDGRRQARQRGGCVVVLAFAKVPRYGTGRVTFSFVQDSDDSAPTGCQSAAGVADENGATIFNDAVGDLLVRVQLTMLPARLWPVPRHEQHRPRAKRFPSICCIIGAAIVSIRHESCHAALWKRGCGRRNR